MALDLIEDLDANSWHFPANFGYHTNCYAVFTDKGKVERAQKRGEKRKTDSQSETERGGGSPVRSKIVRRSQTASSTSTSATFVKPSIVAKQSRGIFSSDAPFVLVPSHSFVGYFPRCFCHFH